MTTLAQAVARRAAAIKRGPVAPVVYVRPPQGATWLPTPQRQEVVPNAVVLGQIKLWDLSPVDVQNSFDPFTPPSALPDPPTNTVAPIIQSLGGVAVGDTLAGTIGAWTGSPTYVYSWQRGASDIAGATTRVYVIAAADLGAMLGYRVVATNAGGSTTVDATPVGPVTPTRAAKRRSSVARPGEPDF
jgi:hypothetical protein